MLAVLWHVLVSVSYRRAMRMTWKIWYHTVCTALDYIKHQNTHTPLFCSRKEVVLLTLHALHFECPSSPSALQVNHSVTEFKLMTISIASPRVSSMIDMICEKKESRLKWCTKLRFSHARHFSALRSRASSNFL